MGECCAFDVGTVVVEVTGIVTEVVTGVFVLVPGVLVGSVGRVQAISAKMLGECTGSVAETTDSNAIPPPCDANHNADPMLKSIVLTPLDALVTPDGNVVTTDTALPAADADDVALTPDADAGVPPECAVVVLTPDADVVPVG